LVALEQGKAAIDLSFDRWARVKGKKAAVLCIACEEKNDV
jgi:hypothetical protein